MKSEKNYGEEKMDIGLCSDVEFQFDLNYCRQAPDLRRRHGSAHWAQELHNLPHLRTWKQVGMSRNGDWLSFHARLY